MKTLTAVVRETGLYSKQSKMGAFRTVPERLLRPVARALSARNSEFLASKATLGKSRMYRAVLCKELGKPLVVEQVPAAEKLKASQVSRHGVNLWCCFLLK